MHFSRAVTLLCLFTSAALAAPAEKWTTSNGVVEGKLSAVYGATAHIVGKKTMHFVPLDSLDDASIDRVAKFLEQAPAEKPWKESASPVAKATKGQLQFLKDGKLVSYDPGARVEPEFYLLYFSAHWCGPCRAFTPKLVETYKGLKNRSFGEKCEILFMSWDRDRGEHLSYVSEVGMPWLVVKYNANLDILEKWKPNSIPGLAVINRNGDVLFHSHEGGEYHGPSKPLKDLLALLREMEPQKPSVLRGTHRLAMRQHVLSNAKQASSAKPHYIAIDSKKYNGLNGSEIAVHCRVTEKGTVESFTTEPTLPAAYGPQLRDDIAKWLFLPAVENGRACPQETVIPLKF